MTTRPAGSKLAIASRMTIKLIISIVFVVVITSTSYTNFYITEIFFFCSEKLGVLYKYKIVPVVLRLQRIRKEPAYPIMGRAGTI